jgi:hypothetical protein
MAVDFSWDPFIRQVLKVLSLRQLDSLLFGSFDDGRGQWMLAAPLQASRQAQECDLIYIRDRLDCHQLGLTSVRVPVLSTTRVST